MLRIEKDLNDNFSIDHKEDINIIHKSMDFLIISILNNYNNYPPEAE
jgi:hypothetical protein